VSVPINLSFIVIDNCSEVIELKVAKEELDGRKIRDLGLPNGSIIAVIYRNAEVIIGTGETIIRKDDILTIMTKTNVVKDVMAVMKEKF